MARTSRQQAESSLYHITARGCGRRRLFDTNSDRAYFMKLLEDNARRNQVQIKAWCLMENHFHLLVRGDFHNITPMMHRLNTTFALHFNKQSGHVGHVFQGRYHSVPVKTDEQLLATIRYIHLNPVVEGIASLEKYAWSSYLQYLGSPGICEVEDMRALFGGERGCQRFHEAAVSDLPGSLRVISGVRMSDAEAAYMAAARFGEHFADSIAVLPTERRAEALRTLSAMGISNRQIERLTGIGRGIIQRACRR